MNELTKSAAWFLGAIALVVMSVSLITLIGSIILASPVTPLVTVPVTLGLTAVMVYVSWKILVFMIDRSADHLIEASRKS